MGSRGAAPAQVREETLKRRPSERDIRQAEGLAPREFAEGYNAPADCEQRACPYRFGSAEGGAWLVGYRLGRAERGW